MTDTLMKELDKIESLSSVSTIPGIKNKSAAIGTTLDELQAELHKARAAVEAGEDPEKVFADLNKRIENSKKQVDERQKEHNNALARFGKAVDKVLLACLRLLSAGGADTYLTLFRPVLVLEISESAADVAAKVQHARGC